MGGRAPVKGNKESWVRQRSLGRLGHEKGVTELEVAIRERFCPRLRQDPRGQAQTSGMCPPALKSQAAQDGRDANGNG